MRTIRPEPGESEAALRELFMELETIGGGVLVLDNVECCAGGRGRGDRLTSQLVTLLDTCRYIFLIFFSNIFSLIIFLQTEVSDSGGHHQDPGQSGRVCKEAWAAGDRDCDQDPGP